MESLLVNILVVGKVCVSSYTKLDSDVFCERRLIFFCIGMNYYFSNLLKKSFLACLVGHYE